jgi:MFS transporter, FSR family, fosmidomycin resistance protein
VLQPHHRRLNWLYQRLDFLRQPSVLRRFMFFFSSTSALGAVQSFAGPALEQLHALPLSGTANVVSGFMLCSTVGLMVRGFFTKGARSLERVIASAAPCGAAIRRRAA